MPGATSTASPPISNGRNAAIIVMKTVWASSGGALAVSGPTITCGCHAPWKTVRIATMQLHTNINRLDSEPSTSGSGATIGAWMATIAA